MIQFFYQHFQPSKIYPAKIAYPNGVLGIAAICFPHRGCPGGTSAVSVCTQTPQQSSPGQLDNDGYITHGGKSDEAGQNY